MHRIRDACPSRGIDRPRALCTHAAIFGYAPPVRQSPPPSPQARAPRRTTTSGGRRPCGPDRRTRDTLRFEELGLSADLLRTVAEEGYTEPTPVQERAIPLVLAGRDVLAAAQTGTGKTAAFTLPILDRLRPYANTSFSPARHPVRCLVLTPTRELAVQVAEAIKTYGRKVPAARVGRLRRRPARSRRSRSCAPASRSSSPRRAASSTSSASAPRTSTRWRSSSSTRRTGCWTWASCPTSGASWTCCPTASRTCCSRRRSRDDIKRLAGSILANPETIEVARHGTAAETVRQLVYPVDRDRKEELLAHLILEGDWRQVLVFTRTKLAASRLASWLDRHGVAATAIHSRPRAVGPDEGARGVQGRRDPGPRRDRRRGPRPGHRGPAARRQLRAAVEPRGLRPPHRPDGPGRRHRRRDQPRLIDEADLLRGVQRLLQRRDPVGGRGRASRPRRDQEAQPLRAPRGAGGLRRWRPVEAARGAAGSRSPRGCARRPATAWPAYGAASRRGGSARRAPAPAARS